MWKLTSIYMLPLKHLDESGNAYVITISTKCKVYKAIDIKQIIVIYSQNGDTISKAICFRTDVVAVAAVVDGVIVAVCVCRCCCRCLCMIGRFWCCSCR